MLKRWFQDLRVASFWIRKDIVRRWRLDTPSGFVGAIAITTGVILLFWVAQSFAVVFRGMFPWVSGPNISHIYWSSISFGLKVSFAFLLFTVAVIIFFVMKIINRR